MRLSVVRCWSKKLRFHDSGRRKARPYKMLRTLLRRGGGFGEQFGPELTAEGLPSV
jgi:hypothetical protein